MRSRPPLVRTVLLLAGAFVAAAVLVLCLVRVDRVVVATGAFTGPSRPVRAQRAGVIVELPVASGERVEEGALLARLDPRPFTAERAELAARRAGLEARRAEFERETRHLQETVQPGERETLARTQKAAELLLEAARTKEARYAELNSQGLVEKAELEGAELDRKIAEVELDGVRAQTAQRPELERAALAEIEARAAEVEHSLAELDAESGDLERRAAQGEIVAPVAGCLLAAPRAELMGRAVAAGDELMRVAVPGVDAFIAHLDDRGRARARVGLAARLRLKGYPWLVHGTVEARVAEIADRADELGYQVRLELDDAHAPGPLFEGMGGYARIATAEKVSILRLIVEELFRVDPQ